MALRVLAIAQAGEPGGAELALLRLAPALTAEGIELELAVPAEGGVARRARELGLRVHELPLGPLRRGGWPRAVLAWPRARALVRRVRADAVWLNGVVPQRIVPALGRTPAMLHLHDLIDHTPAQWRGEAFGAPSVWWPARPTRSRARPSERVHRASGCDTLPVPVEAVRAGAPTRPGPTGAP